MKKRDIGQEILEGIRAIKNGEEKKFKVELPSAFDVKIPNKITAETFKKTDEGKELNSYDSIDDFAVAVEEAGN